MNSHAIAKDVRFSRLLHLGWLVPLFTYAVSYVYLAIYHQRLWLFDTLVHESGKYTLFETTFYASHFLGHIPMLLVISFLVVGTYLCLSPREEQTRQYPVWRIGLYLLIFLVGSLLISLWLFGSEDTWAFISQQEQNPTTYIQGGAWNLHLTSSVLLFLFMPMYLVAVRWLLQRPVVWQGSGVVYLGIAVAVLFIGTAFFNRTLNVLAVMLQVWQDPRYLAHGVREIATFPVTFFPLAVFLLMRKTNFIETIKNAYPKRLLLLCTILFALGIVYQVVLPLRVGIGELAQKPEFATQGQLGIAYLLTSHYFEHFLDTIFFALLCWLLYNLFMTCQAKRKRT